MSCSSSAPCSDDVFQACAERSGDLELECSTGKMKVFSQMLLMASPVLHDILDASVSCRTLKVEGSKEAWQLLLAHLYPTYPRPKMSLSSAHLMLPVAHMYNVLPVLAEINAYLSEHFPSKLSSNPSCPGYIMKWLKLADDLQLDDLRKLCMTKLRNMAIDKDPQLVQALIADPPKSRRAIKGVAPKPNACPSYANTAGHGAACVAWCTSCKRWACSFYPGKVGCCPYCRTATLVADVSAGARWFPSDQPKPLDSIKSLSRDTVDELLVILVAVCSGDCSKEEPAA